MGDKSNSRKTGERSRVSRKTLRKTSAPLALAADGGGDGGGGGEKGGKGEAGRGGKAPDKAPGAVAAGSREGEEAAAGAVPPEGARPDGDKGKDPAGGEKGAAAGGEKGAAAGGEKGAAAGGEKGAAAGGAKGASGAAAASAPDASAPAPEFEPLLPADSIPSADPASPAPPPGLAPPGDSRSLRRGGGGGEEFVLVYRDRSFVITRAGAVGSAGTWHVVEYPSQGAAAHGYAQTCSRLVAEGYHDLR